MSKEEIISIPLKDLEIDYTWNTRSMWETESSDGGHSMAELVESIKENGQRTPVDVIVHPKKRGKYFLVSGFRRATALTTLGDRPVQARVLKKTLDEATLLNVTENVEREDLRAADVCEGIGRFIRASGWTGNQTDLGKRFGLSQSYISKHLQILEKVKPEIIQAWREGRPVGATDGPRQDIGILKFIIVAQVDQARQQEQYHKLLGRTESGEANGANESEKDEDKAMKEAARVGAILGRLETAEVITIDGDFRGDLTSFVPSAEKLPRTARERVAGALALAVQTEKNKAATQPVAEGAPKTN